MPRRDIEKELEALRGLKTAAPAEQTRALRKALRDSVNLIVARGATLAASLQMNALIPDLCEAFDRMMADAVKNDPQCWAKTAIAKALADLEHTEAAIFLRGLRHIQMEGTWGRSEDTAYTLRGTCALALAAVRDLPRRDILQSLLYALSDSYDSEPWECERAAPVRRDAVRAMEQMQGEEAALLLRLKARMGDPQPAVVGQVFDALLSLEAAAAVPFVAAFLRSPAESVPEEAAAALGSSRLPEAVGLLIEAFATASVKPLREAILRALGSSREKQATDFLINLIQKGKQADASAALDALSLYPLTDDLYERTTQAATVRTEESVQGALAALTRSRKR